jgi:hypothetical protein
MHSTGVSAFMSLNISEKLEKSFLEELPLYISSDVSDESSSI